MVEEDLFLFLLSAFDVLVDEADCLFVVSACDDLAAEADRFLFVVSAFDVPVDEADLFLFVVVPVEPVDEDLMDAPFACPVGRLECCDPSKVSSCSLCQS